MLKILGWAVLVIFLIGLLVVFGAVDLIAAEAALAVLAVPQRFTGGIHLARARPWKTDSNAQR